MEKPQIDKKNALNRLQALCAKSERCTGDIKRKLALWKLPESDSVWVLQQLVADGFVDDVRFTQYYVRDKVQYSRWGRIKIRTMLRAKGVSADIIEDALLEISPETDSSILGDLLSRKLPHIKAKSKFELKSKLIRFGVSRGFDLGLVIKVIDSDGLLVEPDGHDD